jgi:TP901 family phage tail tape measure protein
MKGVSVGGVEFRVGVNITEIPKRLEEASKQIKDFHIKMKNIRMDAIFSGDPFKNTIKYMKKAETTVNDVYRSWRSGISNVYKQMGILSDENGRVAEQIRTRTEGLVKKWEELRKEEEEATKPIKKMSSDFDKLKESIEKVEAAMSRTTDATKKLMGYTKLIESEQFKRILEEYKGTKAGGTLGVIKGVEAIPPGKASDEQKVKTLEKLFSHLHKTIAETTKAEAASLKDLEKEYIEFGREVKKVMVDNAKDNYRERLAIAQSEDRVQKEKLKLLEDLKLKEAEYKTNIKEGFEIEKNRAELVKNLNQQRAAGKTLDKEEIESIRKMNAALGKQVLTFEERKQVAQADAIVLEKNSKKIEDLKVKEEELRTAIANGVEVQKNRIALSSNLNAQIEAGAKFSEKEREAINKLNLSLGKLTASHREQLQIAASRHEATARQEKAIKALEIQEEKLRAEIEIGMNVDKNKAALYDNINSQISSGKKLKDQEILAWRKLGVETGKVAKSYEELLARAKNSNLVLEERDKKLKKLKLEEAKYRTELQLQINTKKNTIALSKNLNQQRGMGAKFTKSEISELQKLEKASKRFETGGGFGTKKWFMQRAAWFIQLRGYWLAYRAAIDAMRGAFEFEQEIVNVKAIAQATTEQFEKLKAVALEVGQTFRYSAAEAAQAMVTLAQAGYSTREVLTSIKEVSALAAATLFGLKESADLVTAITRAWGKATTETTEIVDTLATATNVSRLNMNYLGTTMNYVAGVAPQVNLSLKQTLALLGTMANRGMNASIAATSLRGVIAELLKPTERFYSQIAKLGVTLEEVDPKLNSVFDILVTLKNAGWDAENSFNAFERRVAAGSTVLIQNANSLRDLSNRMHDTNRAAAMAEENLNTASGQFKQFQDTAIAVAYSLKEKAEPAIMGLISLLKGLTGVVSIVLTPLALVLKMIGEIANAAIGLDVTTRVLATTTEQIRGLENSRRVLKALVSESSNVTNKLYELRDVSKEINEVLKEAKEVESDSVRINAYRKVLDLAREKKIITESELDNFSTLIEREDKRREIVEEIQGRLEDSVRSERDRLSVIETAIGLKKEELELQNKIALIGKLQEYGRVVKKAKTEETPGFLAMPEEGKGFGEKEYEGFYKKRMKALEDSLRKIIISTDDEILEQLYERYPELEKLSLSIKLGGENLDEVERILKEAKKVSTGKIKEDLEPTTEREPIITPEQEIKALALAKERLTLELRGLEISEKSSEIESKASLNYSKRIADIEKRVRIQREIAENERKSALAELEKDKKSIENLEEKKNLVEDTYDQKIVNIELEKERKLAALQKKMGEESKEELETENKILALKIKRNKRVIKELSLGSGIKENQEEIERLIKESTESELRIIDNKEKILGIEKVSLEIIKLMVEEEKALASASEKAELAKKRKAATEYLIKKVSSEQKGELKEQERVATRLNESFAGTSVLLQHDLNTLQLKLKQNKELLKIYEAQKGFEEEIISLGNENADIQEEMRKKKKEQLLLENPLLAAYTKLASKAKDLNEALSDAYSAGMSAASSNLSKILFDFTGGFQEQQQEVETLKGRLQELSKEYDEALAEGNAERIAEIKNEMNSLNQEISDLQNPIKQTGEMFKDMLKSVVDGIRQVINEWIAMQIITGITKGFLGGGSETLTTHSFEGGTAIGTIPRAHGGLTPKIEAFKTFSTGGLTGSPTLALLGDNPSGQELVIPKENIQKDNVSGFVREKDKTPINVVNLFSEDDIVGTMSSLKGRRVIVNTIGQDMRQNQPTSRRYSA